MRPSSLVEVGYFLSRSFSATRWVPFGEQGRVISSERQRFTGIAFEYPAVERKPITVEHQAKRHQWTVAAFLFGAPTLRFGVHLAAPFKMRVGQVI